MPSRTRERSFSIYPGGHRLWHYDGSTVPGIPGKTSYEAMSDFVGNPEGENPMSKYKISSNPLRVNGLVNARRSLTRFEYFNLIPFDYSFGALVDPVKCTYNLPSFEYLVTEVLARANPASDPDVDALNLMWELKEFPRMLQHLGDLFRRRTIPSAILSMDIGVRFGWKPLMSDLKLLLATADAVERRRQRLIKAKGPGYSFSLGSFESVHIPRLVSWAADVNAMRTGTSTMNAWASFRYENASEGPVGFDEELYQRAVDLTVSSQLSYATIWNSIPWSWLIDYLSNVGTFLESNRGGWPYKVASICLMRETIHDIVENVTNPKDGPTYSGGKSSVHEKRRDIVYDPTASIVLSQGIGRAQLANLASLALAIYGRSEQVQRATGVKSPKWYRRLKKATKEAKRGRSYTKLR